MMAEEEEELLLEDEEESNPSILSNPIAILSFGAIALSIVVVLSAIVATVVTNWVKPPNLVVNPEKEIELVLPPEPYNTYDMGEFLVRLTDPDVPRYLKINALSLAYDGRRYKYLAAELGERKKQIKALINDVLIAKSSDVATYSGKKKLKAELCEKINQILTKGEICDIYMEVLIQ
jgi:flagellar basal body-associated protein FliL